MIVLGANLRFAKHLPHRDLPPRNEPSLYQQLGLAALGLSQEVFEKALSGYQSLYNDSLLSKPEFLSIADFSQSANIKRLYVIDMINCKVLFHTYVAHGRNSGDEYACSFGNKAESYKSSLGFYLTGNTYQGAHGLSLRLKGCEAGINDHAEARGIVIHGADYVSDQFIRKNGRLGRSHGCPAVPENLCRPIVNSIKDGSVLFIFYPDTNYFKQSVFCD